MQLNDKPIKLDTLPTIISGRTFVPVRAITEALSCALDWDAENETVNITDNSDFVNLDAVQNYAVNNASILFDQPICQWQNDAKAYYADLDFDGSNEIIGYRSMLHQAIQPAIEIDFILNGQEIYDFTGTQYDGLYAGYIVDLNSNDNTKELLTLYGSKNTSGFTLMRYENKNSDFLKYQYTYGDNIYEFHDFFYQNINYSDRLSYVECYGDGWLTFTFESGAQAKFKEVNRGYLKQIN